MRPPSRGAGLWARSSLISSRLGSPVRAAFRNGWHTSGAKRPQTGSTPAPWAAVPRKNREAHSCLNGPGAPIGSTAAGDEVADGSPASAFWGKNAPARSCQVMAAATTSTRSSVAAVISAIAPPYDAPATPTRGSPSASNATSSRWASTSIRARESAIS